MSDASDPTIVFDEKGYCNYCTRALSEINTTTYFPNEEGARRLQALLNQIKLQGRGKPYDCLIGISGGLDSSYLAYLGAEKWGLRIIAVHIDDGFDTEISKQNIKKLTTTAGINVVTIKPDAEQYNALLKAYMYAGVPNLAIPQDNILFACLYKYARKNNIKYFLSGGNFALESILQQGNTHSAMDVVNIRDIYHRFGTISIKNLEFISSYHKYIDQTVFGYRFVRPLNYINYNRVKAFQELYNYCGFEYYGSKHLENIFTAFVQLYWLPKKFGVDKRTSHFSSMIVSGQMSRKQAIEELGKPICDETMMAEYVRIIKEKLGIKDDEFAAIMNAPTKRHTDYKTDKFAQLIHSIIARRRNNQMKIWDKDS